MLVRKLLALACAALLSAATLGAQNIAQDPKVISTGPRLAPRSEVMPYSSREAAVTQSRDSTDYIIPLKNWSAEKVEGGTRYTARFKIPYTWHDRAVILRNTGASSSYSVELNGVEAGYTQLSAERVEFDLTKLAQEDYNTLAITVYDNPAARKVEHNRPAGSRVGEAYIVVQPKIYIRDFEVETEFDNLGRGQLALGIVMKSTLLNPKDYNVYYELVSPSGEVIDKAQRSFTANPLSEETVRFSTTVRDPNRWNHESPYLYTVIVRTQYEGRFKEYVAIPVGFRDIGYSDGRVSIDGKPVTLATREYAWGADEAETRRGLEAAKAEGINCIIVKGNPQTDRFYTLCDELGLYVIDQAAIDASGQSMSRERGGTPSNDPEWEYSYRARIEQMYYSSKLHPSVVGYSLARNSSNGYCLQENYITFKETVGARPVVYFEADGEWNSDVIAKGSASDAVPSGTFTLTNSSPGVANIRNDHRWATVEGTVTYGIRSGRNINKSAVVPLKLAPGESMNVVIPVKEGKSVDAGVRIETDSAGYKYNPSRPALSQISEKEAEAHKKADPGRSRVIFDGTVEVSR